ncbi:amylo-alpha-1,6-glucosidase [Microvirga calopogonii]|uniref:amylo-alpha-1,6-glucosidase n=1 Tax=Microvirga calopogonii TaxID=2078013 RepID=UPI000E0D2B7D|nr:amylo-alpha-1,6-glucosidase [Microvirga calopogonii]
MNDRVTGPSSDHTEPVLEQLSEGYIEAQNSLVERTLRTLKTGDAFAVLDSNGDCGIMQPSPEGLFFQDTRYLSRFELRFDGKRPLLLGSVIQDDNAALTVDLTNPDIRPGAETALPRDIIALNRTKFLWQGVLYERIGLRNYDTHRRVFHLECRFAADFRDLFEVRGMQRAGRGRRSVETLAPDRVVFSYEGLDGIVRQTMLRFEPWPTRLGADRVIYEIALEPDERRSVLVTVACEEQKPGEAISSSAPNFLRALRDNRRALRAATRQITRVKTSNSLFNEIISRSSSDMYMLATPTEHGLYPYAGIPWYSTVFGRDGIITAMMLLWADPAIARGVLRHLAEMQATEVDPAADAQPGKILHERRLGEMAQLGEVPFRRYYGTVDATPLFVMLAGQYYERTGDRETIEAIWPNIEAALRWCDEYGDRDGDGFIEYHRETEKGLANQGWKDSHDSIFHADGSGAEGPIALCEVQAYVFAAKQAAARLAHALHRHDLGDRLTREAGNLREEFEAAFWCEEIGTYALALDGAKRPCRVRTSNAGHALFAGIADPERARRVAATLLSPDLFSGWGIRTLARGEARYNPMSYHNGSVWPHDNGLIALGLARYGLKAEASRVFKALFEVATYQESRRLPELFCGFTRRRHRGPTAYPVACSPQAWAAATPFALLQASLGLELDYQSNTVRFNDPILPDFLGDVLIKGLRLNASSFVLRLHRHEQDMALNVLERGGDARIILLK